MQPQNVQSQKPSSSRALRPSQKQQQTRVASPPAQPKIAATAKATSSTHSSVLTRDRLQSNLAYYQFLTRVQQLLIDTAAVSASSLHRASLVLRPADYDEVTYERSNDGRCGWPACSNDTQPASKTKGRYRLSLRQHRVWQVEGGQRYCSERCEEDSADYAVSLKEDPLYMRRVGELMAAMQQSDQQQQHSMLQQQTAQELLASLPAQSGPHSSQDALRDALPPNVDISGLVIKENSDELVQPVVSGEAAAAIDRYSQQHEQLKPQSTSSLSSASAAISEPRPTSSPLRKASHVQSTPRTATASTASLLASSDGDEDGALLDFIARTAISEKAKLHQTINPISDASHHPTVERSPSDDDSDLRPDDEAKQSLAAMRLSPFAQLAGLLTHYVTDDTTALLRSEGSMNVTPAGSEVVRRRQEALLGWLHGELKAVCDGLGMRATKAVMDGVDAVALTFLLNESVPAPPSSLWQVMVAVILLALHRRSGGGATFGMDEQAATKFVEARSFTAAHLAALMDILLPPVNHTSQASTSTITPTQPAMSISASSDIVASRSSFVVSSTNSSLLSAPRYILSFALSFLSSADLSTAALVCSLFRSLSHPLSQHSEERGLLAHHSCLTASRMHTLGYRDGVQEGRELLMQAGFDAGVQRGWRSGRAEQWPKGVLAALTMWSEKRTSAAASTATAWSAADESWLWRQCELLNGAVMWRLKERGGRGAIGGAAADEQEGKAAEKEAVAWEEQCARLAEQLGADGRRLFDRLAAEMADGKSTDASDEQRTQTEERDVDARIAAAELGSGHDCVDGASGQQPAEAHRNYAQEADADDFI